MAKKRRPRRKSVDQAEKRSTVTDAVVGGSVEICLGSGHSLIVDVLCQWQVALVQPIPAAPTLARRATHQQFRQLLLQLFINILLNTRFQQIPTLFDVEGQSLLTMLLCPTTEAWRWQELSNSTLALSFAARLLLRKETTMVLPSGCGSHHLSSHLLLPRSSLGLKQNRPSPQPLLPLPPSTPSSSSSKTLRMNCPAWLT